jgi:hypothetical protein
MHIIWVGSGLYQTKRKKPVANALAYFTATSAAKKENLTMTQVVNVVKIFHGVTYEEAK